MQGISRNTVHPLQPRRDAWHHPPPNPPAPHFAQSPPFPPSGPRARALAARSSPLPRRTQSLLPDQSAMCNL